MKKIQNKKWWKSKTLQVGVLQVVGGVLLAIADQVVAGGLLTFSGVLAIILRVVTDTKIEM